MKNRNWEAVHQVYSKMEALCGASLSTPGNPLFTEEEIKTGSKDTLQPDESRDDWTTDDIVRIRAELRMQLDLLRATLSEQYSERDVYLLLFPIVAHIDELIQTNFLRLMQTRWPLLQKELFEIENAGEVFYEIIDDILLKPQTSVFIYEIYYFCLSYGFRGRYEGNPVKVGEYMKKLQSRLPRDETRIATVETEAMGRIGKFGSPVVNYMIAAAAVVVVYGFFKILGRYI